jgi:two-component system sensor histidine kinase BaeS
MRLRLWHRLFLAFAALSVAIIAGFGVWQQWNFREGFSTYLNDVSTQRLETTADRLADAYGEHGSWEFLRNDPRVFDIYVDTYRMRRWNGQEGAPGTAELSPPQGGPPADDQAKLPPPASAVPPLPPREVPGRGGPGRDLLLDKDGQPVVGNTHLEQEPETLRVPVEANGKKVGYLVERKFPTRAFGGSDLAFTRGQRRAAIVAGAVALLIAFGFAFAIARWLLAPVRALMHGVHAMTAGDYTQRVASAGSAELGALARDFNRLAHVLESHREARRRWGADIAHELRTPLSVLRGEISALQDGVRQPTPAAFDSLAAEGERLSALIEDLYQLSLADAGALEYHYETLDFAEVVRDAAELQKRACADAGLALELALPNEALPIRGDGRRLGQLLDNLIANARRYTEAPGRIRIALTQDKQATRLTIDDTPPGVPVASLPHLFERLYRVDTARARSNGGAGLGLAICRAIVEAHGGEIRAEASDLGGLRILVELPQDMEKLA